MRTVLPLRFMLDDQGIHIEHDVFVYLDTFYIYIYTNIHIYIIVHLYINKFIVL